MEKDKKNILVIFDNNKKEYTYEKRSKGLLKRNRAFALDSETIQMKQEPDETHVKYWISQWCLFRKNTMIKPIENFRIHPVYLNNFTLEEFYQSFLELFQIFSEIYFKIALDPIKWGFSAALIEDYRFFSPQERKSRTDSYAAFKVLFCLLNASSLYKNELLVDAVKFNTENKISKYDKIFNVLENFGFEFFHLKNNKMIENQNFKVVHSDFKMLHILKMIAQKAQNVEDIDSFFCCSYHLFEEDLNEKSYNTPLQKVLDLINEEEKHFLYHFHQIMVNLGYYAHEINGYEGSSIAYSFKKSEIYTIRIAPMGSNIFTSIREKNHMLLMLRLRNVNNCIEHLETAPQTIKTIFKQPSDHGCANRLKGCNKGVEYTYEGIQYWRCGCYQPTFIFKPKIEDINHYLKLLDLGSKKL